MKKLLFILLLPLFSSAQILVMDVVQIKKGKAMDYESVEAFISPVQKQAIEDGNYPLNSRKIAESFIAIEKDKHLFNLLSKKYKSKIKLINQDVLTVNWENFTNQNLVR